MEEELEKFNEELKTLENGKYKDFILTKDDISFEYGYAIFDVENKDQNKSLDAIAYSKNLGKDYRKVCNWLVSNTEYFPGSMRLEIKLFVIVKRLNFCLMFSPTDEFVIPFDRIENKEDGELQAITLKYNHHNKILFSSLLNTFHLYFNKDKEMMDILKEKHEIINNLLDKTEIE